MTDKIGLRHFLLVFDHRKGELIDLPLRDAQEIWRAMCLFWNSAASSTGSGASL